MASKGGCPRAERLSQYLDGELPRRVQAAVARHLHGCPRCRQEIEALERLQALLGQARAPAVAPDLASRIQAACAGVRAVGSLSCRRARALISVSLDGELEASDEERLWAHLFQCPRCLRRYRETERLTAIARRPREVTAPAYLPARILAAVRGLRPAPSRRVRRPAVVGLSAAVLVLVAGVLTLALHGPRTPLSRPAQAPAVAYHLPGPPAVEAKPPADAASVASTPEAQAGSRQAARRSAPLPARGGESLPAPPGAEVALPMPSAELATPAPHLPAAPLPAGPASAYAAPTPAPAPTPIPAPSALPLPTPPPAAIAAVPPSIPATPRPLEAPSLQPPPALATRPVVTHTPPEPVRQLRWTPAQESSVVVFQRRPSDHDKALAAASEALSNYERRLQRSETKGIVVNY